MEQLSYISYVPTTGSHFATTDSATSQTSVGVAFYKLRPYGSLTGGAAMTPVRNGLATRGCVFNIAQTDRLSVFKLSRRRQGSCGGASPASPVDEWTL